MKTIITTDRLRLRHFTPADYDAVYQLNSDAEVMQYIFDGHTHSREEAKAYLDKIMDAYKAPYELGVWAVELKDSGDFVGFGCLRVFEEPEKRELGYRLGKPHWGKGIASEISRGLVQYGFQTLNLPQIMAVVQTENIASRKVLEKAGLTHQGLRFHYGSDLEYYEMDNPNLTERLF